jgi:hypothetical protein
MPESYGPALDFDGVNDYVELPSITEDKSGNGTHGTLHGFTEHDRALTPDEVRELYDEH